MLTSFFRINLPYGIIKNNNDEWTAFNREYMPLGYNQKECYKTEEELSNMFIYTKYERLTEKVLFNIAGSEDSIERAEDGTIKRIFLYSDSTSPMNKIKDNSLWNEYWRKLTILSNLKLPLE